MASLNAGRRDPQQAATLALRRRQRAELLKRRDNLEYFDAARSMGPQVFLDTIPCVLNCILLVTLGNVAVYDPLILNDSSLCTALVVYLEGLVVFAYALLALLIYCVFAYRVTLHIRGPYLFTLAWMCGICAWTFVGLGAVSAPESAICRTDAPLLFGISLLELLLAPLLAAVVLIKWTGEATKKRCIVWRKQLLATQCYRCCARSCERCCPCCKPRAAKASGADETARLQPETPGMGGWASSRGFGTPRGEAGAGAEGIAAAAGSDAAEAPAAASAVEGEAAAPAESEGGAPAGEAGLRQRGAGGAGAAAAAFRASKRGIGGAGRPALGASRRLVAGGSGGAAPAGAADAGTAAVASGVSAGGGPPGGAPVAPVSTAAEASAADGAAGVAPPGGPAPPAAAPPGGSVPGDASAAAASPHAAVAPTPAAAEVASPGGAARLPVAAPE